MSIALSIATLVIVFFGMGWWLEMNAKRKEIRIHSLRRRREARDELDSPNSHLITGQ